MPSTYAHYKFGQDVLNLVREDIKKIIKDNIDLFNIGVHGPDIFFYYRPIVPNKINEIGHKIHEDNAGVFFVNSKKIIKESEDIKASISYILGFICHYVLDNQCHGYIEYKVKNDNFSHSQIEVEFDKTLLIEDGYDPLKYNIVSHIHPEEKYSYIISNFYDKVDSKIITQSIIDFIRYNRILYLSSKSKRQVIFIALKMVGEYDNLKGMFMSYNNVFNCETTSNVLRKKFDNSINIAVKLIEEFYDKYLNNIDLSNDFNKTFLGEESCE